MPILEEEIYGRLGKYTLSIFENKPGGVEEGEEIDSKLESDVIIEYGKLERQPYRQIIKSYCSLSFVDENLELHKRFRGEFSQEQYFCEIVGPNVKWKGILKEENRTTPITGRTQKERTVLRFYGGLVEERLNRKFLTDLSTVQRRTLYIHDITDLAVIDTVSKTESDFAEGELIRSNIEVEFEGDWLDVTNKKSSGSGVKEAQVIDVFSYDKLYEAFKKYCRLVGSVLYKSLKNGNIVFDDSHLVGSAGIFQKKGPSDNDYSSFSRRNFVNRVKQGNIIDEGGSSGIEDLERAGDIIVSFQDSDNVTGISSFSVNDQSPLGYDEALAFGFSTLLYDGRESGSTIIIAFDNDDTRTLELGEITPTLPLGFVVEFERVDDSSNHTVTLRYNNASGDSNSISGPKSGNILVGPTTEQKMDPELEFEYTGGDVDPNSEIEFKVKYIDSNSDIVESLIADEDQGGVKNIDIEFDTFNPTAFVTDSTFGDKWTVQAYTIRNNNLGIESKRPYLFKSALEREYRPSGTQTLRGKLIGLFGPEYVHKIVEDNETTYWIPVGLKCNLNTGTTEVSLQEMPNHTLA